jgi:hypothetical protein
MYAQMHGWRSWFLWPPLFLPWNISDQFGSGTLSLHTQLSLFVPIWSDLRRDASFYSCEPLQEWDDKSVIDGDPNGHGQHQEDIVGCSWDLEVSKASIRLKSLKGFTQGLQPIWVFDGWMDDCPKAISFFLPWDFTLFGEGDLLLEVKRVKEGSRSAGCK